MKANTRGTGGSTVAGVCFRPLRPDDVEALYDLICASRAVDGPADPVSREEVRHLWFEHPGFNAATDTLAAADARGTLAGAVAVLSRDLPTTTARVFMPGTVRPTHRGRGIGTHLIRYSERRARELLAATPPGVERQLDGESPATATNRIAMFEREGFRRARTFLTMRRDLSEPIDEHALPAALSFVEWRPDLDEATRHAHNDAFRDHWGSDPLTAERWQHFVAQMPGFTATCSWLAIDDGGSVAGYTLATLTPQPGRPPIGWLGTIGVRRTWRHQGVASALVARCLACLRDAGATRAGLDVDAENPTGAVRVYESLGFHATEESIIFSKPIRD